MNILLTNDDGINAEGINVLCEILSRNHNVYMIAPNEEKSGSSCAITLREPLRVESISDTRFAVHGFPVDCVSIGINGNIIPTPDLIVSGINNGPNLGDDVFFSGTVAGARAAFIFGISGISISLDCPGYSDYFHDASEFLLEYIENSGKLDKEIIFFNINYPDILKEEILGIKYTFLGKRKYDDYFETLYKSDFHQSLQLNGTISSDEKPGSDTTEISKGYISITPMSLDCTDYSYLEKVSVLNNPLQK